MALACSPTSTEGANVDNTNSGCPDHQPVLGSHGESIPVPAFGCRACADAPARADDSAKQELLERCARIAEDGINNSWEARELAEDVGAVFGQPIDPPDVQ